MSELHFANKTDFSFNVGMFSGSAIILLNDDVAKTPASNIKLEGYAAFTPVSINLKYSVWYLDGVWHSVYPYTEVESGRSSFRAGLRIGIDKNGEVTFAVPLMWTIVFDF